MLKKFLVLVLMLSLGLLITPNYIASNNEQLTDSKLSATSQAATITITAGSDGLVVGTPIILNDLEFISFLSLETVFVVDGHTILPTQYDSELGELVFQLPSALEAHSSATFEVRGETSGSSNGQSATIKIGQGDYDATYNDWLPLWATTTFMNGTTPANMVKAIGDVIWVETDWGILCLAVEAIWRQSTWRHVIMKAAEWDAVGTHNWNACSNWQFQWAASLFQDADEGWQHGALTDTVTIKEVGPVRAVIQTVANSDYQDLLAQSVQNCNATRTYTIYDGFVGIAQHFTLTGANATQAMTDFTQLNDLEEPLRMKHQMMDGRFGEVGANNLTKVHVPGLPAEIDRGTGAVDMSAASDPYFAIYNDADKHGYVYNFATLNNLMRFEPGNEIIMNYAFDAFPENGLNRYFVPFVSYTGNFADHAASLNKMWTAEYTVDIAGYEQPVPSRVAAITVTAGSDQLMVGTPIIIDDSEFTGSFSLETAVIFDGITSLPTQYDSEMGELVFQLPRTIASSSSATFELQASKTGTSNGQIASIIMGQGDYDLNYNSWLPTWASATFKNSNDHLSPMVRAIGDVIWVETDWGILCLAVEADWRQGTWRHVIMKDANWDAVGTHNWNASSDWQFQWAASLFQDADEGWQRGAGAPDTIEIKKVGPVRAVIRAVANADYYDLYGQSVSDVNATRTYTIYNGFAGISQHFTLSGANAEQAMIDFTQLNALGEPLRMKHQMLDGHYGEIGANNLTKIHVPGLSAIDRGPGPVDMIEATDSYFAIYDDTLRHGYIYNWGPFKYKDNLVKFEPNNEIVMNYAFDAMPPDLYRFYIPFSSYSGTIADHSASLNIMWTAGFTITTAEYEPTTTQVTTTKGTTTKGFTTEGFTTVETTTEEITPEETTEPIPSVTPGFIFVTIALGLIGISVNNKRRK